MTETEKKLDETADNDITDIGGEEEDAELDWELDEEDPEEDPEEEDASEGEEDEPESSEESEEDPEEDPEEEDTSEGGEEAEGGETEDLAAENARLKQEAKSTEALVRAVLKALGTDSADIKTGLAALAGEAKGKTAEEFIAEHNEASELERLRAISRENQAKAVRDADLAQIKAAFPSAQIKDVSEMKNFERFKQLRLAGCTAAEAYAAVNSEKISQSAAEAGKRQAISNRGMKSHLRSNVTGRGGAAPELSTGELREWREIFPDKSDKELHQLARRVQDKTKGA